MKVLPVPRQRHWHHKPYHNIGGKRLELLKEAVPQLARVAVLYDPASRGAVREVKEDLSVAARALGFTIQPWEVRAADGFDKVFSALNKQRRMDSTCSPVRKCLLTQNGSRALR